MLIAIDGIYGKENQTYTQLLSLKKEREES